LFVVFLTVIYIFVPRIYKSTVVDNANLISDVETHSNVFTSKQYNRLVRIMSVDIVLSAIMFGLIFYYIVIIGYQKSNFQYIVYGIALLIFYTICTILIYINKLDPKYMTTPGGKGPSPLPEDLEKKIKQNNIKMFVPQDLGLMLGNVMGYYTPSHPDQALFYMLAVWLITFCVFIYFFIFTTWTDSTTTLSWTLLAFLIPFGIPLLVFIIKS
jgi:hypothetical protein